MQNINIHQKERISFSTHAITILSLFTYSVCDEKVKSTSYGIFATCNFKMYFTEYWYWNKFFQLETLLLDKHFNKLRSDDDVISILQNCSLMRPLISAWRLYPASLEIVLEILMDYFLLRIVVCKYYRSRI